MHLKQKGYNFGVLLVYTITTLTLPSGGREPVPHSSGPGSHRARRGDRNRGLTSESVASLHPVNQADGKPRHLDPGRGEQSTRLPPDLREHPARTKTSRGTAEPRLGPWMESSNGGKTLQNHHRVEKVDGQRRHSSAYSLSEDCGEGEIKRVVRGTFYRTGHPETRDPNPAYQPGSALSVQAQTGKMGVRGQRISSSEESWQRLQPVVECGDKSMTLVVRRRRASQLLLHRVNESSLPLSQLPPECGYSVQTSWKDLNLLAQYDGCHVTEEGDSYVLPLLWRGTPVLMSCPVAQIQSEAVGVPSLCCSPYGIIVRVQGASVTEELSINVRSEWTPVVLLAESCGYTLDRRDAEIVITAPFITCGITLKDGKYTFSLRTGDTTFTVACPLSPPDELHRPHQPLTSSPHHSSRGQTEPMPKTPEPFPWVPPFYLAPPHYPHPTYRHKDLNPDVHDARNPPTAPLLPPDPQLLAPADSQPDILDYHFHQIPAVEYFGIHSSLSSTEELKDSTLEYTDLQQKQEAAVSRVSEKHGITPSPTSASDFTVQIESPPSHSFNPYYHYYHHPKIPLIGPPQDPDPGPVLFPHETSSVTSHNPDFPSLTPNVQQHEAQSRVNSDQLRQALPSAHPYPLLNPEHKVSEPYPPQPYPHHYFYYFPYYAVERSASAAETNLFDHQNTKYNTHVHPPLHSSVPAGDEKHSLNPYITHSNPDGAPDLQIHSPEWLKPPLWSEHTDLKPEEDDIKGPRAPENPEQPSMYPNTPSHKYNPPPYLYYYHPYDYYYWTHYRPETSFKEATDPLLQASSSPSHHPSYSKHPTTPHDDKRQTTTPVSHIELMDDVEIGPENPFYYYDHLYQRPETPIDHQQLHPAVSTKSENEPTKSESGLFSNYDYSMMDWFGHAAKREDPEFPPDTVHSSYIAQQLPYLFEHLGGKAEKWLDNEMGDRLKADMYTPSASPCGLGTVSDFDCSITLGCCTYPVKDCTVGEHFVFPLPNSVVEPEMVLPAHPSEVSKVTCTLQRLTSDPYFYTVPLDGCGVNKHMFGQMVVYLLEIQVTLSLQDRSSVHEKSSVRLMVECLSSPGYPGEVTFHVLDPPPFVQSTPVTVTIQLRIATDESFTSFHPGAYLPLSVIRGRPVYVELNLLDPPGPDLVLLVHYCLAFTQTPYASWVLIYDRCSASQLLPSPHPHHIRRIRISSFLFLPSQSPSSVGNLEDPQIYFLCVTEVCSVADDGCINSPNSDV